MGVAAREEFDAERWVRILASQDTIAQYFNVELSYPFFYVITKKAPDAPPPRAAIETEVRRRRLTSYRLLQPRTTASIRNRYICKVCQPHLYSH